MMFSNYVISSVVLLAFLVWHGQSLRFYSASPTVRLSQNKIKSMALFDQKGIVTMYKKEGCPYCIKAIQLLQETYGLEIKFVDIESEKRCATILKYQDI